MAKRNKRWSKGQTSQVLALEKLIECQNGLIADLSRIQGDNWRSGATMDENEAWDTLERIGKKVSDEPTLYLCHHCIDTGFLTKTDNAGQVFGRTCDHCQLGKRRIEARKVAHIRAQGGSTYQPVPD